MKKISPGCHHSIESSSFSYTSLIQLKTTQKLCYLLSSSITCNCKLDFQLGKLENITLEDESHTAAIVTKIVNSIVAL